MDIKYDFLITENYISLVTSVWLNLSNIQTSSLNKARQLWMTSVDLQLQNGGKKATH